MTMDPNTPSVQAPDASETGDRKRLKPEFHGSAGEFFRIWIVNTFLTLVTVGIYGAWAKVRTNKYFYRNTELEGSTFDYHAQPVAILKGRMILALGLLIYFTAAHLQPGSEIVIALLIALVTPWLFVRAVAFTMHNTSYRNIRFGFDGRVKESLKVFYLGMLATLLTLGLAYPWFARNLNRFRVNNSRYGRNAFDLDISAGSFFKVYAAAMGLIVASILIPALILGLQSAEILSATDANAAAEQEEGLPLHTILFVLYYLLVYLFIWTFIRVLIINRVYRSTAITDNRFESRMKVGRMFWIYLSNTLLIMATLGLAIPWAKIRVARYRVGTLSILSAGGLSGLVAHPAQDVSATGEEVGDYLDLDLGF